MPDDPDRVVLDQLVVTYLAPKALPDADAETARRVIASARFRKRTASMIAGLLASTPATAAVTVDVSA